MTTSTPIFILTSEWQDLQRRHLLRYYGLSRELGTVEVVIDHQKPLFFIPRSASFTAGLHHAERKAVPLKNFAGEDVDALYFSTRQALRDTERLLRAGDIPTYEADVQPDRRYLMERFIYAQAEVSGKAVKKGRLTSFLNPKLIPCEVTPRLVTVSLDIETGPEDALYSIAVHLVAHGREEKRVFMRAGRFGTQPEEHLYFYPTEQELLEHFFEWFQAADPDIIIGWHVIGFDLMFLERKCRALHIPLDISRSGRPPRFYKPERGYHRAEISGRVVIDGPATLRGAFFSFEDYKLETVSQALLGTGKIIQPDQDKVAEINRLFREDKPGLARYNLEDAVLVTQIFQKTGLIDLYVRRSQISGLLLNQVGLSVAAFDYYYLPRLHRKGYVAINTADVQPQGHAAGGYVMEPAPGIYDDVVVLDFKSLYPSIIQSFKIDPLSRLRSEIDTIETPDDEHYRFSASEHILPEFIDRLMALRSAAKKAQDGPLSQAIKILMNSFYGVMGTYGCRFYHPHLPSAITGTGQWLLKGCRRFLEARGYRVLYGDTDSVFVQLKPEEAARPGDTGQALAGLLNQHWQEELQRRGVTSYLEMEYEKYYRKLVLPLARGKGGGARKRYAGLVDKQGTEGVEFVGMEYVRSDWTPLAREFQYELYLRILTDQPLRKWLNQLVRDVYGGKLDEKLVYHKHLRKEAREYTKNISPQVRAALMVDPKAREIRYLITLRGPVPEEHHPTDIDYQHYIDKQLKPIADSVLGLLGKSFDEMVGPVQLSLFDGEGG